MRCRVFYFLTKQIFEFASDDGGGKERQVRRQDNHNNQESLTLLVS